MLLPLESLRAINGMNIKGNKLYQIIYSDFGNFFDFVNEFEQKWNAFLFDRKQQLQYLSLNKLNEIEQFNQSFYNNYTMAEKQLAKLVIDIRRGDQNESTLTQLFEKWEFMTELSLENIQFYEVLKEYLIFVKALHDIIPNLVLLNRSLDFDDYLMANNNDNAIVVYSFNGRTRFEVQCYKRNKLIFVEIKDNIEKIGNNITFVAFNYEINDRLAKYLVNRTEKCVICLFSKSRLIAYDLKQFYEKRKLIEEKVNQIRDKIGKYDIENVS